MWLFNESLKCTCKYCVDGSISHVKFLKVVQAHILTEANNFSPFCSVFLPGRAYHLLLKSIYIWYT